VITTFILETIITSYELIETITHGGYFFHCW